MKLVQITPEIEINNFDCGDYALNNFLVDSKQFFKKRLALTYIFKDEDKIAAYFSLLNDKISRDEITNNQWRKIKNNFPYGKQFRSYPAIKIGRFAVSNSYRNMKIGTKMMDIIKNMISENNNSVFRYLTVDSYISAIPFYLKNGFVQMTKKEDNDNTRLMIYDMTEL